jgi:hypothetical protein
MATIDPRLWKLLRDSVVAGRSQVPPSHYNESAHTYTTYSLPLESLLKSSPNQLKVWSEDGGFGVTTSAALGGFLLKWDPSS